MFVLWMKSIKSILQPSALTLIEYLKDILKREKNMLISREARTWQKNNNNKDQF